MAEQRQGQRLKFTLTHYRQPHVTHEEFMKWIVEEHLKLAMPVFKKHGVLSYTIFVTPASLNVPLKEAMSPLHPTWDFADFDCFIEYIMPSQEAMANMQADPAWHESLKDQEKVVDTKRSLLSLGYAVPYLLETGEVLNMPK